MSSYSSFSDVELAELLKTDDSAAYTVIYNRYFHTLYVHAFQKLNDKQEAQDVVHELFAQLWNKRKELKKKKTVERSKEDWLKSFWLVQVVTSLDPM